MSVTALTSAASLRTLHPMWCLESEMPHADDEPHRGRRTCWEVGDVQFTLNFVRYGETRYGNGWTPADADEVERVELTLTDPDFHGEVSASDLGVRDLEVLISLLQQKLDHLRHPSVLDYPREA